MQPEWARVKGKQVGQSGAMSGPAAEDGEGAEDGAGPGMWGSQRWKGPRQGEFGESSGRIWGEFGENLGGNRRQIADELGGNLSEIGAIVTVLNMETINNW
jgi:hypothetical protein